MLRNILIVFLLILAVVVLAKPVIYVAFSLFKLVVGILILIVLFYAAKLFWKAKR